MKDYDSFAPFYDLAMGDRRDTALLTLSLLKRYAPKAGTLLELGCGSGSMLKILSRHYRCTGIDLSAEMIRVAKRKVPQAGFLTGDISKLELKGSFDAIICVFDTINHLPDFRKWQSVFRRAARHLAPGGVFIFDINTVYKIDLYDSEPPYAETHADRTAVFEVKWSKPPRYTVDVRVFRKTRGADYRLHEMRVNGAAFPAPRILRELKKSFGEIRLVDPDRRSPSKLSEELFFVCRRARV